MRHKDRHRVPPSAPSSRRVTVPKLSTHVRKKAQSKRCAVFSCAQQPAGHASETVFMDSRKRKTPTGDPHEPSRQNVPAKRGRRSESAGGTIILDAAPPRPTYKKPGARTLAKRKQQPRRTSALERLNAAILCGALWHKECQSTLKSLPDTIGVSFASVDEYVATFEPLLHEEAREAVKSAWSDNCDLGNNWEVGVDGAKAVGEGWVHLELNLQKKPPGRERQLPVPGSVVVLSSFRPPKKQPMEAVQKLVNKDVSMGGAVVGTRGKRAVQRREGRGAQNCTAHGIVAGIVGPPVRNGSDKIKIHLYPACSAHAGSEDAPCKAALQLLRPQGRPWYMTPGGSLITQQRECEALDSLNKIKFLSAILHPENELKVSLNDLPRKWPNEVGEGLHNYVKNRYDSAQSDAIAMCTAHFATAPSGPTVSSSSIESKEKQALPIALIQGPPGTGKTHTVIGVLNLWHLVQFQRYYERVVEQYRHSSGTSTNAGEWDNLMGLMKTGERRTSQRPRILVCAPSNAATDELLGRILKAGFSDAEGRRYFPNVVRVGSEDAPVSDAVKAVWLETLVSAFMKKEKSEWDRRFRTLVGRKKSLCDDIAGMEMRMQHTPGQLDELASGLISALERKEKLDLELQRLEIVQPLIHGAQRGEKEVREELGLSYLNSAEMVFTTLSSTSKKIFFKAKRGFETVLIDEAAQANEVSALQPLVHGCSQCVLVGDPQQLPATVLSQRAKELQLERSLFERLQLAGCPVEVLTVQYRMHPQIRQFPSAYFYGNALEDGPDIKNDSFTGILCPWASQTICCLRCGKWAA